MNEKTAVAPRFQLSVRTILAATAILALLMVPITWVTREREQMRRAREDAIRAVVLAERYRSKLDERAGTDGRATPVDPARQAQPFPPAAAARIQRLEHENAELRDTVELLQREVERLKGQRH
jgi:hypothetical protein